MNLKQQILDASGREKLKLIKEFKALSPRGKIQVIKDFNAVNKLSSLMANMEYKYSHGESLKEIYDATIEAYREDGKTLFQEFINKNKSNQKLMDEFNKTSFIENISHAQDDDETDKLDISKVYSIDIIDEEFLITYTSGDADRFTQKEVQEAYKNMSSEVFEQNVVPHLEGKELMDMLSLVYGYKGFLVESTTKDGRQTRLFVDSKEDGILEAKRRKEKGLILIFVTDLKKRIKTYFKKGDESYAKIGGYKPEYNDALESDAPITVDDEIETLSIAEAMERVTAESYETLEFIDSDSKKKVKIELTYDSDVFVTVDDKRTLVAEEVEVFNDDDMMELVKKVKAVVDGDAGLSKDTKGFRYGLRHRPFGADPKLAEPERIELIEDVSQSDKKKFGDNVRHGILVTKNKLSPAFIESHELVDLDKEIIPKYKVGDKVRFNAGQGQGIVGGTVLNKSEHDTAFKGLDINEYEAVENEDGSVSIVGHERMRLAKKEIGETPDGREDKAYTAGIELVKEHKRMPTKEDAPDWIKQHGSLMESFLSGARFKVEQLAKKEVETETITTSPTLSKAKEILSKPKLTKADLDYFTEDVIKEIETLIASGNETAIELDKMLETAISTYNMSLDAVQESVFDIASRKDLDVEDFSVYRNGEEIFAGQSEAEVRVFLDTQSKPQNNTLFDSISDDDEAMTPEDITLFKKLMKFMGKVQ